MHLGEIIKMYRAEHSMSQAAFASISGISKGYISMLENNKNPATGEPLAPTYTIFEKVARVTGYTTDDLMRAMDDRQMISVNMAADALDYTSSEVMEGIEKGKIHINNLSKVRFDADPHGTFPQLSPQKKKLFDLIDSLPDDKVDAILRLLGEE